MSADNWAICPKCLKLGNVSEDDDEIDYTLREDYEQWMDKDGMYRVHYSCRCQECGFNYKYEYIKQALK